MGKWLLTPPVAFIVTFFATWMLAYFLSGLAAKPDKHTKGEVTSYACGEADYNHMAQPDYSTFFPFAFFFTLAHVATLTMTTVPVKSLETLIMPGIYILGTCVGLIVLFRR